MAQRPPKPTDRPSQPRARKRKPVLSEERSSAERISPRPKGRSLRPRSPTLPVNPNQTVARYTAVYLIHQRMIGRLAVTWSALEGCMQSSIWEFLALSMSGGRIIASRLDALPIISILKSLGIRYLIDCRRYFLKLEDEIKTSRGRLLRRHPKD
jgi:hypothetical protein